jgi:hypothetical protein
MSWQRRRDFHAIMEFGRLFVFLIWSIAASDKRTIIWTDKAA